MWCLVIGSRNSKIYYFFIFINHLEYDFLDKPIFGDQCEWLESLEDNREEREKELNIGFLRHCVCDALIFNPENSKNADFL